MEPTEVVTTVEPTIVESTPSEAQIVEQSTPMDSNVTYNNISEPTFNPGMEPVQNLINDAVTIEHDMNVANNAGKAMNNFLTNKYDYNKNEAGTYWVAGAINDTKTQMSFLQTLINEEMYDEMDLQKYYYDTNLATARAYAAQKEMETAYGFYRAAQEKALAEANLTGWYMPAEGQYLLGQYTAAQRTLEDPDAAPDQLAKANRITKTAEEWFAANQITTRGIKCLSMLQFEETVRNNTVMAKLEDDANKIAANQNAAASAMAALNLREFKYSVEEAEMLSGRDFTYELGLDDREGYIGHHYDDYEKNITTEGYKDAATMLVDNPTWYSSVFTARGKEYVDNILKANGYDSKAYYNYYSENAKLGSIYEAQIEAGTNYFNIKEDDLKKLNVKTSDGKELYTFAGRVYAKNNRGFMEQITKNIKTSDGKTVAELVTHFTTDTLSYNNKNFSVGTAANFASYEHTYLAGTYSSERGYENSLSEETANVMKEYMEKGYVWLPEKYSKENIDAGIVMYNAEENKYIEISDIYNDVKTIKEKNVADVKSSTGWADKFSWDVGTSFWKTTNTEYLIEHSSMIGTTTTKVDNVNHTEKVFMFVDSKNNAMFFKQNVETGNYDIISQEEAMKYADNPGMKLPENFKTTSLKYEAGAPIKDNDKPVSQKEAVDNLTNYNKNSNAIYGSTNKTDTSLKKEDADTSKEGWEKAVERAEEEASKTTTPVPTQIGEGKQGKTINDVQTELGRTPTKTFGEIFDAYSIPKNEREFLLKTYKTPEALERFLSNKYNGFLGTGG